MGVYINGMEMPDYGYVCVKVFANGDVVMTKEKRGGLVITGLNEHIGMAIPVTAHGRLIDADALLYDVRQNSESYFADDFAHEWVDVAPTVIPADREEQT